MQCFVETGKSIPTAFASIPGHIFMMFGTGITKNNRLKMCLPSEMYCINDNKVWVPGETTWMDKSFIKAWERGASLVKEHQKANELKAEAEKIFEQSAYDFGHSGYTGSFAEKDEITIHRDKVFDDAEAAQKFIDDLDSDKWGPADVVPVQGIGWLMAGWCSS